MLEKLGYDHTQWFETFGHSRILCVALVIAMGPRESMDITGQVVVMLGNSDNETVFH